MLKIEVIAKGDAFEMGVAQGEHVGEKIRSAPNVLAQLYGFRAMKPAWMPYPLYLRLSESRATRFLENSLQHDFVDAYARMKGISAGSKTNLRVLHLLHALEPMLSDVHGCSVVPDFAGCSAVAVRGRRSAMHEPVIV